jgi:molybdenum cofactor cytidylyltransferase
VTAPLPGIVLAAGASQRMGRPKALLPIVVDGPSFARALCDTLAASGVAPVVLVSRAELRDALAAAVPFATVVVNPSPERGQLSSLLAGLDALDAPEAVLVTLVDLPLVRRDTVQAVLRAWQESGAPLVRPEHAGRHGHPVIFGAPLLRDLRSADAAAGAKPIVHRYLAQSVNVVVNDEATVEDVDTPEAYARLMADSPSAQSRKAEG